MTCVVQSGWLTLLLLLTNAGFNTEILLMVGAALLFVFAGWLENKLSIVFFDILSVRILLGNYTLYTLQNYLYSQTCTYYPKLPYNLYWLQILWLPHHRYYLKNTTKSLTRTYILPEACSMLKE